MPDAVTYRRAVLSDAPGLATVHVATWRTAYRGIMPDQLLATLSVETRTKQWTQMLSNPEMTTWLAQMDDRLVGFANVCASRDCDASSDVGELLGLYVLQSVWHRGFGRALTQAAFHALAERGFQQVTAWVLGDNKNAAAFYEQIGMRTDGAQKSNVFGGCALQEVRYRMALSRSSD
jgi:ribosomal protein S18 acetylase RimI-like enzyme